MLFTKIPKQGILICCFSHKFLFLIDLIFLLSANEADAPTQEDPTQENAISNIKIAYISFAVAFVLLLLCFVVAFCSYKKSTRKRIERLHIIVANSVSHEISEP